MGFDLTLVLSDDKHYSAFRCEICQNLVSLDAVVTNRCAHPFCRTCLESWVTASFADRKYCACPACQADISRLAHSSRDSMVLGFHSIAAQPLQQAQPLAFQVLKLVQVACISRTNKQQCEWSGDYGEFLEHAAQSHGGQFAAQAFVGPQSLSSTATTATNPAAPVTPRSDRPSMNGLRSLSSPSVISTDKSIDLGDDDEEEVDVTKTPIKKSLSLRDLNEMEETSSAADPISLDDLQTPRNNNNSIASQPETRKPLTPAILRGDAPPLMVQRTISESSTSRGPASVVSKDERKYGKVSRPPKSKRSKVSSNHETQDSDLEVSYSQALDWNTSINSLGAWHNSTSEEQERMETLAEDEEDEDKDKEAFQLDFESEEGSEADKYQIMERAEKLKKQANAKFNKGDFAAARSLYADGIEVMNAITAISADECELLSNMHSNRAVTYFREKKFEHCIEDCEMAISYDPTYDKSWIRKWRALMALGDFDLAYTCLEQAAKMIPDSKKILEELGKCQGDKELLTKAREMLELGDFQQAREILKPFSRTSDNIGLLFVAARADAGLGLTESALEKVNKALRYNPTHTEGLEIRGHTLFLTGETEKGAHLLQEAYSRNKENKTIRMELMRCQKTHSAFTKGRSCVKRGRYSEAVDHFSNAVKESGQVPQKAPLFGILRTERAEAFLLSKRYLEALKDCQEVLNSQRENAPAWSVRAEILIALGKAEEAKGELDKIRSSWGSDNPTIDEAYRRVDFELRVMKADEELIMFVQELDNGDATRLLQSDLERRPSRRNVKKSKSQIGLGEENGNSPRGEKDSKKRVGRSERRLSADVDETHNGRPNDENQKYPRKASRSKSRGRNENGRSQSRGRKDNGEDGANGDRSKSTRKGPLVPPPSVEDMANGVDDNGGKERRKLERSAQSERNIDRRGRRSHSVKRT